MSLYPTLLSVCHATSGILCFMLVLAGQKRKMQTGWTGFREGPKKMSKELGSLPCEKRLRAVFVQPGEMKSWGDLIMMFECLKCGYKKDGDSFFSRIYTEKMRGNGCNVLLGTFLLDTE